MGKGSLPRDSPWSESGLKHGWWRGFLWGRGLQGPTPLGGTWDASGAGGAQGPGTGPGGKGQRPRLGRSLVLAGESLAAESNQKPGK